MRTNRIFVALLTAILSLFIQCNVYADLKDYTTLRDIDIGTFNEYRYYMVKDYFKLKEQFELKWLIDTTIVLDLLKNAKTWYNYLPDNLMNQNYYNDLVISVKKWYEQPNSEVNYQEVVVRLNNFLEKVNIQSIKWDITVTPITWNAPLTVTFRWKVTDPSWSAVPSTNYVWWFDAAWVKKIIWRGLSINYTFVEEWNYAVFLDVKSTHKNANWYNDVIPFSSRANIQVKEKVASLLVYVNSKSLKDSDEIKFTPDEASYWLIFDATSSIPTWWAKFISTEWDFWNWIYKRIEWDPKIERVVYSREWSYPVLLRLTTNEWNIVDKRFNVEIHKPIATIEANSDNWYIWDRFTFTAKANVNDKHLSYSWRIIDVNNDKVILSKDWNVVNNVFNDKWRFNLQLKVKDAAWNEDTDTKIIYINSRPPIANYKFSIPDNSKPNRVLLDWTNSYDPDFNDDWKLKYIWKVDWEIVDLEQIDSKWALWYYTFDSIWDHSINLEVVDPDQMNSITNWKINIKSVLSVELFTFPRAIQRDWFVKFIASSQYAKSFEWDFGDWETSYWLTWKMEHIYKKSWSFKVKVTVKDSDWNINETSKVIYVWESNNPLAVIWVNYSTNEIPNFDENACWNWAYIVDRTKIVNFAWWESINIDWTSNWLSYSWKIWTKNLSWKDLSNKFDELWCFPIKLTVTSDKKSSISTANTFVKVVNIKPTFSWLDVQILDDKKDPVVVWVSALWAQDPDWVIQSYLWYYYTDSDSDPQDFRITKTPNTTFVLPKITWNYYFVLVMKDNNDEKTSSEDIQWTKYSITLSWDNVNTPLIDFKVNKNSLLVWEEAVFTTNVKNILWQDINSKSTYAWDFDGDWFYDKETSVWNVSYKYQNSWTFYTKVRVKYKWMTNVRNIEINVANILEPKFDYISLWNTYLFFNNSSWKFDKVTWDMWDGNTVNDKNFFTYTYQDSENVHNVNLKISEWSKIKEKSEEVKIDIKKMISLKNSQWLNLIWFPEINNWEIILDDSSKKAYIYVNELKWAKNYVVDFDIDTDSDLNWGKDDDIDNKTDSSYSKWWLVEILLNDKKNQTVLINIYDDNWKIIESKKLKIIKEYVKEEILDMSKIVFAWVSDKEKEKIEKLKSYVKELPQEHRLKAMKYVQKLQEDWFYANEKTKVILEFESFIDSIWIKNSSDIINLLESLLVQWQEDQSVRNMAYNVVKNLIPNELVEYKDIIANLDQIKSNPDKLEDNKLLGKKILESIKDTSLIKNEDKITIKSQLQVFIYWSIDNIPKEVVQEVKKEETWWLSRITGLFSQSIKFIWFIFFIIIWWIFLFFIWYKVSNKNKSIWLQDFIIEKTANKNWFNDILWDFASDMRGSMSTDKKEIPKPQEKQEDLITREEEPKIKVDTSLEKPEILDVSNNAKNVFVDEKVPDWLKWALDTTTKSNDNKVKEKQEESKNFEFKNDDVKLEEYVTKEKQEEKKLDNVVSENFLENVSKNSYLENTLSKDDNWFENQIIETKIEDEKIPDWLKGSLDISNIPEEWTNLIQENIESQEDAKTKNLKKTKSKIINSEDVVVIDNKNDKKSKSKNPKNEKQELWDDWMDIPDWLKIQNTNSESIDKNNNDKDFWTLDDDSNKKS